MLALIEKHRMKGAFDGAKGTLKNKLDARTQGLASPTAGARAAGATSPVQKGSEATKVVCDSKLLHRSSYSDIKVVASLETTQKKTHTTSKLQKKLLADVQLQATLATRALRSGRTEMSESELLADFACQMQVSVDTYNAEVNRQIGLLAGVFETEKSDGDLGLTSTKSTLSTFPGKDLPASNAKSNQQRCTDAFNPDWTLTTDLENPDVAGPVCKSPPVNPRDPIVIESSPPEPASQGACTMNRPCPESLQKAHCAFCKRPPENPNYTSCGHIVCCFCVEAEIDEAYEHGRYPTCPACLSDISEVTPLRWL